MDFEIEDVVNCVSGLMHRQLHWVLTDQQKQYLRDVHCVEVERIEAVVDIIIRKVQQDSEGRKPFIKGSESGIFSDLHLFKLTNYLTRSLEQEAQQRKILPQAPLYARLYIEWMIKDNILSRQQFLVSCCQLAKTQLQTFVQSLLRRKIIHEYDILTLEASGCLHLQSSKSVSKITDGSIIDDKGKCNQALSSYRGLGVKRSCPSQRDDASTHSWNMIPLHCYYNRMGFKAFPGYMNVYNYAKQLIEAKQALIDDDDGLDYDESGQEVEWQGCGTSNESQIKQKQLHKDGQVTLKKKLPLLENIVGNNFNIYSIPMWTRISTFLHHAKLSPVTKPTPLNTDRPLLGALKRKPTNSSLLPRSRRNGEQEKAKHSRPKKIIKLF